ncbi:hypothetical protein KCU93_g5624, partial [Aureobasidium melanogenum]
MSTRRTTRSSAAAGNSDDPATHASAATRQTRSGAKPNKATTRQSRPTNDDSPPLSPPLPSEDEDDPQPAKGRGATSRGGKRGGAKGNKPSRPRAGRRSATATRASRAFRDENDAPETTQSDQTLKEIEIEPNEQTRNINNWNEVKDQLILSRTVRSTQAPRVPRPWNHLPVYDNRAFEVLNVEQVRSSRRRWAAGTKRVPKDEDGNWIEEVIEAWEITVQDAQHPESDEITLYAAHIGDRTGQRQWRAGPLETWFCDREAANRVAQQACDRLNRLPLPINPDIWNDSNQYLAERAHLEVASMSAIDPQFDYSQIDPLWTEAGGNRRVYTFASHAVQVQKQGRWWIEGYNLIGYSHPIFFVPEQLDANKILEELADAVPAHFYHVATPVPRTAQGSLTEAQFTAANLLARYLQYGIWGMDFEGSALNNWVRRQLETYALPRTGPQHDTVKRVTKGHGGPCDDDPGWVVAPRRGRGVYIEPTAYSNDSLEAGKLPNIAIATQDRVVIAHVLQAMSLELSTGSGLLNAWQAGCVAADKVNLYMPHMISRARIIQIHCICNNASEREHASHYCMHDSRYIRCCDGFKLDDGTFVCKDCAPDGVLSSPIWLASGLFKNIHATCDSNLRHECKVRGESLDLDDLAELRDHCIQSVVDADAGIWEDAWDGQREFSHSTYRDVSMQMHGLARAVPHFLQPSLDAVLPYVQHDGKLFVHHPSNCVLTTLAENYLRGNQPAYVIYLMSLARQEWRAEQEDGKTRDPEFWTHFYTALDHAMLIVRMVPWGFATRLSQEFSAEKFNAIAACHKSGEFVGSTQRGAFALASDDFEHYEALAKSGEKYKHRQQAREDWEERGGRKEWPLFTDEQWTVILRIHEEVRSSEVYNPDGRSMPLGPGDTTWPFLESHMPRNSSVKDFRDHQSREFILRWHRVDEKCNLKYITGGSPMTLYLTCIICWYTNGGLDEVFGCGMTLYISHMCTISVGRRAEVDPASRMDDGWEDENPTSLDQYNPERRTLTFQIVATNRLWGCTPKEYLAELPDRVLTNIRRETEHYDATNRRLPPIVFPDDIATRTLYQRVHRGRDPFDDFFQHFGGDQGDSGDGDQENTGDGDQENTGDGDQGNSGDGGQGNSGNGAQDSSEAVSVGGEEAPQGTSDVDFEIGRFSRRVRRGERLAFNEAALAVLERARALEAEAVANGRSFDPMRGLHNGLRAEEIIPLAKVGKDGSAAWTHDDMNTWLFNRAIGGNIPQGTALLTALASNYIGAMVDQTELPDDERDNFKILGNPFVDTNAEHVKGGITKAVMVYCSNSHYVVLAFGFHEDEGVGRIHYWNSKPSPQNYSRVRRFAPIFGAYLAEQEQVNLPHLEWRRTPVFVEPQTRQPSSDIDCGPVSTNTLIHVVRGTENEVARRADVDAFVSGLRYRYLSWAFEQYMGCTSMVAFLDDYFRERRQGNSAPENQPPENPPPADLSTRMGNLERLMLEHSKSLETVANDVRAIRAQLDQLPKGPVQSGSTSSSGAARSNPPNNPTPSRVMVVPRSNYEATVLGAVNTDHPAYNFAVVSRTGDNRVIGFAGKDSFLTPSGEELARYDNSGNVTNLDGQWIGNFTEFGDA